MANETAWLIEIAGNHGVPNYYQLEYDNDWTPDANKALRFARRQDAQAYINHIGWTEPKPVEHMWCDGPDDTFKSRVGEMLQDAAKRINAARP